MDARRLFVLGGTGFVGTEVIRVAVAGGWEVSALARSREGAERLRSLGAVPVRGDARSPREWIGTVRGADALVDLVQPALPGRIRPRDIERVSAERQDMARALLAALLEIPPDSRPLLVSVSGTDDLEPDAAGRVDGSSSPRAAPTGFGRVGVPVRRIVEAAGTPSTFIYLGTVYGPGKSFAATVFPRLARGRMLLPRGARNRLPLVHVRDAARAVVHLAALGKDRLAGRQWIVTDSEGGARLGDFFDHAAELLGAAPPARVPGLLLSSLMGRTLFETLTRDVEAMPSDLAATAFRFEFPTFREGLPATLDALGYRRKEPRPAPPPARAAWRRFWPLLASAVAALLAVNVLRLPLTVPGMRALAGGETILDLRPGYGPGAAYRFLDALGATGRGRYLEMLWTVDLVLPALFALALRSAIGLGAARRWRWVALAAGAADYLENAAITALVLAYPARLGGVALVAGALTASKLLLYGAALALAAGGGWRARRMRLLAPRGGPLGPTSVTAPRAGDPARCRRPSP